MAALARSTQRRRSSAEQPRSQTHRMEVAGQADQRDRGHLRRQGEPVARVPQLARPPELDHGVPDAGGRDHDSGGQNDPSRGLQDASGDAAPLVAPEALDAWEPPPPALGGAPDPQGARRAGGPISADGPGARAQSRPLTSTPPPKNSSERYSRLRNAILSQPSRASGLCSSDAAPAGGARTPKPNEPSRACPSRRETVCHSTRYGPVGRT